MIWIKPNQSDFSMPLLDGFLSHQDSSSNSNNLAYNGCHCNLWIVPGVSLITHILCIGMVGSERSWEIWSSVIFQQNTHQYENNRRNQILRCGLRIKQQLVKNPRVHLLILMWPLPYSQPELDSYWVAYKIVINSQRLQWQCPSPLRSFSPVFSPNKVSLSTLLRTQQ